MATTKRQETWSDVFSFNVNSCRITDYIWHVQRRQKKEGANIYAAIERIGLENDAISLLADVTWVLFQSGTM